MAGISQEKRDMLNKGYSLYKQQLGDIIHEALVEADANKAVDDEQAELIEAGDRPAIDFMAWPSTPTSLVDAVAKLKKMVTALEEKLAEPTDFMTWEGNAAVEDFMAAGAVDIPGDFMQGPAVTVPGDFMTVTTDPEEYVAGNPMAWETPCNTKSDAIDCLRTAVDEKALRLSAIATTDVAAAEATYSQAQMDLVIGMVNELKAKVNAMNV